MSITNKGKGWEARNSIWLIWVFVFMLNWIAFFWIGGRAKQRKWTLFGCLYLVLCFVLPMAAVSDPLKGTVISDLIIGGFLLAWIGSVTHAFLSRQEYLIKREAVVDNQEAAALAYRQQIQSQYARQNPWQSGYYPPPGYRPPSPPQTPAQQAAYPPSYDLPRPAVPFQQTAPPARKTDLNAASEQQLAGLPGVGVALAKRAAEMRAQTGGFLSVQDFCQKLGLMPHFAAQIENLAFVKPFQPVPPPTESTGRIIDI